MCLAAILLAGCGEASVVHVEGAGGTSISRATLDHWMRALTGSQFREQFGRQGPTGLVAEPADPRDCFDASKLVASRSFFNQLRPSAEQLDEKCRELHSAAKAKALAFLIAAQWTQANAAAHGVSVSQAEVERAFKRERARAYPTAADLRTFLAERQWSLADLLYRMREELLARKLGARNGDLSARTTCTPGYIVAGCRGFHETTGAPSLAAVLASLVSIHNNV